MANLAGKLYEGSPRDIVVKMSEHIAGVLREAYMPASGVYAIALMHVAVSIVVAGRKAQESGDTSMGEMPSFTTMLRVLTHGLAQDKWSNEELEEFGAEFGRMIESIGGTKIQKDDPFKQGSVMMSPSLGVH